MKQSESIIKIAAAIAEAQKTIGAAPKDSDNPFFSSKYADLGSVIAVCKEPLLAQGISVMQIPGIGDKGQPTLETIFLHNSGEYIGGLMDIHAIPMPKKKKDTEEPSDGVISPQALGSAITYARRYMLQAMAFIPAVDDDSEWAERALRARPSRDEDAIESMIAQHLEEAAATKDPDRKRKLLGLVSDLRLKLQELKDSPTETKPDEKPDNAGSAATPEDWRNVECHVGSAGGPILGKTVEEIFIRNSKGKVISEKARTSLVKWFSKWFQNLKTPDHKDKALWSAIQEAAFTKPPSAEPEESNEEKKPETKWGPFVVESKLKKLNGRRLDDMDLSEIQEINGILDRVDWSKATLYQKKLRAMVALALADLNPLNSEEGSPLLDKLNKSGIPTDTFLRECITVGWISNKDAKTLSDISEADMNMMLSDWKSVEEQCSPLPA